jgi:hypothetical protein
MDTSLRWTPGESWPSAQRWSQCLHDARNSYAEYVPIGYRLLGRYLDKAYNSVPGGVGSNPPHAISVYARFNIGAKPPGVATTPLLRELGIAPIEATVTTARTMAFVKAPTLHTCISDHVGQPSRMRPNTWTYGTVRGLDRFDRASAELAQNVRVPPA